MFARSILLCVVISLQTCFILSFNSCQSKTCQGCIQDPSVCVWCAANEYNGTRCISRNNVSKNWCPTGLEDPGHVVEAPENQEFNSSSDHVIQIKPQKYKLKVRAGKIQNITFSFQPAQDYPVDLYFLFDASKTMSSVQTAIATQSEKIYFAMKNMTSNVHLGLGTFIDKRVLPMVQYRSFNTSYSFRHHLKLSDDFKSFRELVSHLPLGQNRDIQEGGFDALAQVMACKDIIGWRNESRKIILFLTDGPYHAAGDGKSAGLFQPYDGRCYTENNSYTKEQVMDYPSVGIIDQLVRERDIIVMFFIEKEFELLYSELSKVISGSKLSIYNKNKVDSMENSPIVEKLKNIYEKVSTKIKLKVNVRSGQKKNIEILFNPDCTQDTAGAECDVEMGKELQINGTVKVTEYINNNVLIDVAVEGISEKLTLDIDVINSCGCEAHVEEKSDFCHGERRFCGECSCSSRRYGKNCICVKSEANSFNDTSTCTAKGDKNICSGRGSCTCGTCSCAERYEGQFCEWNMDSCPRGSNQMLCSGHGTCKFGKCNCNDEWSGDACDCYNLDTDCKGDDGKTCNNLGHCVCGVCKCDPPAQWDARTHQDKTCKVLPCDDCHKLQCRKLEKCAKCQRNNGDCFMCSDRIKAEVLEIMPEEYLNSNETWNQCDNVQTEVGCYTKFVYRYNDDDYTVELVVTHEKDCGKTYFMFGGIFLLTLLLVGAGTLTAWKLLVDARDRREFLRFQQQHALDSSKPRLNDLYESPSTRINNPTYRKRSVNFN
ncbi:integrin beta pat-3-like [Trichoplusia ni]|uniref:Integrin beta n=1 Tax=Trichoplusia ni TaxID=7111 RepID=A0A7E5WCU4_TRINI|nr:integrin beta pat-3-like [Trichoplusia ni]